VKRHPSLVPLSHDHHHGLVQARRLRSAAAGDSATRASAAAEFLRFFAAETVRHFRDEEETIFPLLVDQVESPPELLGQVLLEHQRIHALVARLDDALAHGEAPAELMLELGETLESHIRLEERSLFPLIEEVVRDEALADAVLARPEQEADDDRGARSNEELDALMYSISHDLRAPLRAMDGFSHVLLEQYGERLDERGRDYLSRVRAGAQQMGTMIDQLLRLSRLAQSDLHPEHVDLSAMARGIAAELRNAEPDRRVEFVIADGITAWGDPHLLQTVLENLLANAWKFTSTRQHARIELGMTRHADRPAYFVRDDGVGFDMAQADRLFGSFQRLHHEDEFPGPGMGLAGVRRIVARHGGRVWAEAEPGRGATFTFML
jgi:signal transduction histidine kinase